MRSRSCCVAFLLLGCSRTQVDASREPGALRPGPACEAPRLHSEAPAVGSGVAVVELFTSEGCSSCPPADAALVDLAERADEQGLAVFALGFHVDYWDRLGWQDVFGSAANSERQHALAARRGDSRVYTPELRVNGGESLLGSDTARRDEAVRLALARPAVVAGTLTLELGPEIRVRASFSPAREVASVSIALTQRDAESSVASGENAGRTLRHAAVVRGFAVRAAHAGAAEWRAAWPERLRPEALGVVAWAEDAGGAVLGAARARVAR